MARPGRAWWLLGAACFALVALRWLDLTALGVVPAVQAAWLPLAGATLAAATLLLFTPARSKAVCFAPVLVLVVALVAHDARAAPATVQAAASDRFTVLSVNMKQGRGRVADVAASAIRLHADVLVLVEVDRMLVADVLAQPGMSRFRHRTTPQGNSVNGSAILSRLPVVDADDGTRSTPVNSLQQPSAEIEVGARRVMVQAVHVFPPLLGAAGDWRAGLRELQGRAARWRAEGRAFVMAGDFNAGAPHPGFRDMADGLDQPTALPEWGLMRTWPVGTSFTRLDHVLSHGLPVVAAGSFDVADSDHRGVWAQWRIAAR